jgi:predicted adenine nucleotide alpha hydrolase (AANH) superfamily ATPase
LTNRPEKATRGTEGPAIEDETSWKGGGEALLSKRSKGRRILLHTCCANCAIIPLSRLEDGQTEVFGFFYNPNIHPFQEYRRRLDAVEAFFHSRKNRLIIQDDYDLEGFLRAVVFREETRCSYCYHRRLEATARMAKKSGFSAFTTTLLYSKHQNHEAVREIGENLAAEFEVPFVYEDFRPGWKQGIEESKSMGLYRQHYCGCIYSEKERYLGKGKG